MLNTVSSMSYCIMEELFHILNRFASNDGTTTYTLFLAPQLNEPEIQEFV